MGWTDGQPENIMPLAMAVTGTVIKNKAGVMAVLFTAVLQNLCVKLPGFNGFYYWSF